MSASAGPEREWGRSSDRLTALTPARTGSARVTRLPAGVALSRECALANPPDSGVEYACVYAYCFADRTEFPALQKMMRQPSSNPTIGMAERPFTVHFSKYDSAGRAELERFIGDIFRRDYGAEIMRFKPYLMSLRDRDDKLIAACGLQSAAIEKLSLESCLDQPIEAALSEHTGYPVKRGDIVEISYLSIAEPDMARYLITAINDQLHFTSKQWAVFTAVPALRDAFIKLGMDPEILKNADMKRLFTEDTMEWGSCLEHKPQVMAIRRVDRRNKTRITEPVISAT